MTAGILIGVALWMPGLRSQRVAAQSGVLTGSYGLTLTKVSSGGDPTSSILGVITLDGAGNATYSVTYAQVDPDPAASTVQFQAGQQGALKYTVNADGTGTFTADNGSGGVQKTAFVVTDGGSTLMLLTTAGYGNNLLTGTARKQ